MKVRRGPVYIHLWCLLPIVVAGSFKGPKGVTVLMNPNIIYSIIKYT